MPRLSQRANDNNSHFLPQAIFLLGMRHRKRLEIRGSGSAAVFAVAVILHAFSANRLFIFMNPSQRFQLFHNDGSALQRILYWVALAFWFHPFAWGEPLPLTYEVLAVKDHDSRVFTQGLVLKGKVMTESSGLYGKSFLMQYDVETGAVQRRLSIPKEYFAEGITEFQGLFFLLTWQAGVALVFDAQSLKQVATQPYQGEGWGITHNGQHLIMSNGSDTLSLRKASDFSVIETLQVKDGDRPVPMLNELEFAEDLIWANVWQEPVILAIDPDNGAVKGMVDLSEIVRPNHTRPGQSVLNGIAYDPVQRAFWITGKWWPKRYLVRFHWPQVPSPS